MRILFCERAYETIDCNNITVSRRQRKHDAPPGHGSRWFIWHDVKDEQPRSHSYSVVAYRTSWTRHSYLSPDAGDRPRDRRRPGKRLLSPPTEIQLPQPL